MSTLLERFARASSAPAAIVRNKARAHRLHYVNLRVGRVVVPGVSVQVDADGACKASIGGASRRVSRAECAAILRRVRAAVRLLMDSAEYGRAPAAFREHRRMKVAIRAAAGAPIAELDRIRAFPGGVSLRIFGDRSGAVLCYADAAIQSRGDVRRYFTRAEAAQYLAGLRAALREQQSRRDAAADAWAAENPAPTISIDDAAGRIDVRFAEKPPEETSARLTAAGWRYHGHRSCWYHRDTPANRAFARALE